MSPKLANGISLTASGIKVTFQAAFIGFFWFAYNYMSDQNEMTKQILKNQQWAKWHIESFSQHVVADAAQHSKMEDRITANEIKLASIGRGRRSSSIE